jgi:hypothetical protein
MVYLEKVPYYPIGSAPGLFCAALRPNIVVLLGNVFHILS